MVDLFILIIFAVVFANVLYTISTAARKRSGIQSSDGHRVRREEDLTCETNDGHHHENNEQEFGKRYIVHNDPEQGYVVLNGVKRKITDCKNL